MALRDARSLPLAMFRDSLRTMEDCFVYVLGCAGHDRYLTYVGWTLDLDRRLTQHNAGTGARTTRGRVWVLLHSERFSSRREAMSREWHLKRDRAFRKRLADAATGIQAPRKQSN
jgi:putative endonuclease